MVVVRSRLQRHGEAGVVMSVGSGGRDEKRKGGGEGVSGEWLDLTT